MRRTVPLVLASCTAVLAGLLCGPSARGESAVRTDRVLVEGEAPLPVAEEAATLAEALWPHLAAAYGGEPPAGTLPLHVRLFVDKGRFVEALRAAGATESLAATGGWTSFSDGVSYVLLQPYPFDTRRLVLHEATHQFQIRLVGEAARLEPAWHREGLAEHFGWHRRTSRGLEVGAMDAIARRHRPEAAAERVAGTDFDPWLIATGEREADYTDALALVEGLRRTQDEEIRGLYAKWAADAVRGRAGPKRFAAVFAGREAALRTAVKEAWSRIEIPWDPDLPGWDEGPEGVHYEGEVLSLLHGPLLPAGPATAEVVVRCPQGSRAGVSISHPHADGGGVESACARLLGGEVLLVIQSGGEVVLAREPAPGPPGGPVALRLTVGEDHVRVEARAREGAARAPVRLEVARNLTRLEPWASERRIRLEAQGGPVVFLEIPGREAPAGDHAGRPER